MGESQPVHSGTQSPSGPFLQFKVASPTIGERDFDRVRGEAVLWATHPAMATSAYHSTLSLWDSVLRGENTGEHTPLRRIGRLGGLLLLTIPGGYGIHEMGHFHLSLRQPLIQERSPFPHGMEGVLGDIAGVNATLAAARASHELPHEGISTDLAYIDYKLDLAFYQFLSQPLWKDIHGEEWNRRNSLDPDSYWGFRGIHNRSDEKYHWWATAILGGWVLLDTIKPAYRIIRYAATGKETTKLRAPGDLRLSTPGFLSPTGPVFGAGLHYYFQGHTHFPSLMTAEVYASPFGQGAGAIPFNYDVEEKGVHGRIPFGFHWKFQRVPLPTGPAGPFRFSISPEITFLEQMASRWHQTQYEPGDVEWQPSVLGAGLGIHAQASDYEVSIETQCKTRGFLPNEFYEAGCHILLGGTFSLD